MDNKAFNWHQKINRGGLVAPPSSVKSYKFILFILDAPPRRQTDWLTRRRALLGYLGWVVVVKRWLSSFNKKMMATIIQIGQAPILLMLSWRDLNRHRSCPIFICYYFILIRYFSNQLYTGSVVVNQLEQQLLIVSSGKTVPQSNHVLDWVFVP